MSQMPSRKPRKHHTVVCCIHGTSLYIYSWFTLYYCPAPFNWSRIADYNIVDSMTFSSACPDVGISIRECDVEHTSFHLVCAAARLFCLVSLLVSAPCVVAAS